MRRDKHSFRLGNATVRKLTKYMSQAELDQLVEGVQSVVLAPTARQPTAKQARAQATKLADHAAKLIRTLNASSIVPSMGLVCNVLQAAPGFKESTVHDLQGNLSALRAACQAVLGATDGDTTRPQLDLRGRGRTREKSTAIASIVMWKLYLKGVKLTASDPGVAVEAVGLVLQDALGDAGSEGSAYLVTDWLSRHPEVQNGRRAG